MPDPYVGKQLSERQFLVTDRILDDFFTGLAIKPGSNGHVPSMVLTDIEGGYFGEIAYPYQIGHLWMRQEWELHKPLQARESYGSAGEIEAIYTKRNRNVVKYRVDIRDSGGDLAAIARHHQSFLQEAIAGDNVEFRDPSRKPGMRKFIVPAGQRFGGLSRTISKEMCGVFFHGDANYHTDDESAKDLGFAQIVVGGRMTMSYAGAVLERQFGDRWLNTGQLDLKFTNPVWCEDEVTVHGVILAEQPDPDRTASFIWMSKSDDTIAFVAEASVAS